MQKGLPQRRDDGSIAEGEEKLRDVMALADPRVCDEAASLVLDHKPIIARPPRALDLKHAGQIDYDDLALPLACLGYLTIVPGHDTKADGAETCCMTPNEVFHNIFLEWAGC